MKFRLPPFVLLLSGLVLLATSCISNRNIYYLQDPLRKDTRVSKGDTDATTSSILNHAVKKIKVTHKENLAIENDTATYATTYRRFVYHIQPNDNLQIVVRSKSRTAADFYNKADLNAQATLGSDFSVYTNGYAVSDSGNIEIPFLGKIKVLGLTLPEIKTLVEEKAKIYLTEPFVQISLSGINYAVLGEVLRPNRYRVYQNQVTIFEALADAGDMKDIANRRKVRLVRQYPDGVKVHVLDLTDRNIVHTPYYFIQPNDVIYVRPMKLRELGIGTTGFSALQAGVTVLSVLVLIFTLTRK